MQWVSITVLLEKKIPEQTYGFRTFKTYFRDYFLYQLVMTPHVIQPKNNDFECMQKLVKDLGNIEKGRIIFCPDNLSFCSTRTIFHKWKCFRC